MTPLSGETGFILQWSELLYYVGLVFLNNFLWSIYYKWYLLTEFIINDILSLNISHRNIFILLLWKTNDCWNQIRAFYVPVSLHILFPMTTFLKFEILIFPSLLPPPLSYLLSLPFSCPLFLLLVHPLYKTEQLSLRDVSWFYQDFRANEEHRIIWTNFYMVSLVLKSELFLLCHIASHLKISWAFFFFYKIKKDLQLDIKSGILKIKCKKQFFFIEVDNRVTISQDYD